MSETNRIQVNRSDDDSFRDRIANAISKSVEENPNGDVSDMADAVILELGLKREEMRETGPGKSIIAHRYSTEWEQADE